MDENLEQCVFRILKPHYELHSNFFMPVMHFLSISVVFNPKPGLKINCEALHIEKVKSVSKVSVVFRDKIFITVTHLEHFIVVLERRKKKNCCCFFLTSLQDLE